MNLSGEGGCIIQHLDPMRDSYAWELLNKRIGNQSLLTGAIFDRLLQQPELDPNSDTAVRKLHDNIRTQGLRN